MLSSYPLFEKPFRRGYFLLIQIEIFKALELYKKLLLENKEYLALNVYVSLCYYKLDFFDIAEEILNHYLAERPDSIIAVNLKACIKFQLYQGQAAENELRSL